MDFTFGIITGGSQNHREDTEENLVVERIKKIISTIDLQNIPNYEIIIVGGPNQYENINNLRHVPFDDKRYFGWITKKKNIRTLKRNSPWHRRSFSKPSRTTKLSIQ